MPTGTPGQYEADWTWYDASGRRVQTLVTGGTSWWPTFAPATGPVTYYVYDGSDVALTVVRRGTGYAVWQRYLTEGVDAPIAGRFPTGSATETLGLVSAREGTTVTALRVDGTEESGAAIPWRDAFGRPEAGTGGGSGTVAVGTGFAGGATPSALGGYTYFRNRWYDPGTGRFLTQDPIGLAGGVNLYAYAGNNPVNYSDPFGLCPPKDHNPCNEHTGDPNLDNPTVRQGLEDAASKAPQVPSRAELTDEVGGWCTNQGVCTSNVGDPYSVDIGEAPNDPALAYHTHPNEGKPWNRIEARKKELGLPHETFHGVSPQDRANAAKRSVPTYVVTPNMIIRLRPVSGGKVSETDFDRWTSP